MKLIILAMIGMSILHAELIRNDVYGIVNDTLTNLEWQDNNATSSYNWLDAIDYCENLELGGKNDWRLPNINELLSIADRSQEDTAIKIGFETILSNYWSSTTYMQPTELGLSKQVAWRFSHKGFTGFEYKTTAYSVRCVRGGFSEGEEHPPMPY